MLDLALFSSVAFLLQPSCRPSTFNVETKPMAKPKPKPAPMSKPKGKKC